ncbi:MAG: polymer-forming cytoskeletal protein [Candidatus Falkowbacteria bacterium]
MFTKNSSLEAVDKDIDTVIGASVKVEGNFVCDGNIVIEGEVRGIIETGGYLQIGTNAVIVADVQAGNAKISGKVQGKLIVKGHLELTETAQITGDIKVGSLEIASGAVLNGHCAISKAHAEVIEEEGPGAQ